VLAIPSDEREPIYSIVPTFWTPAGAMNARPPAERDRFREWIAAGHMIEVPGPVIRYSYVAAELTRLAKEFDIAAVAFDAWRIDDFRQDLADVDADSDLTLEPFGQGFKSMSPAIDYFAECALSGRLHHGMHPVLTACVANAITVHDAAQNTKIEKAKSNRAARYGSTALSR
jgi:phage terminase large subunit-like protein